ncbi:MAG: hypothetical protein AAF416_15525 [Pseudomonadota bacterium]
MTAARKTRLVVAAFFATAAAVSAGHAKGGDDLDKAAIRLLVINTSPTICDADGSLEAMGGALDAMQTALTAADDEYFGEAA